MAAWGGAEVVGDLAERSRLTVAVLADTHLADRSPRRLPPAAEALVGAADVVIHAGDVTEAGLLDHLAGRRPVVAVLGNNDRDLVGRLHPTVEMRLAGVAVAVIHDSGAASGRERRMARRFPGADVVVFGHSHIPWNAAGEGGQLLFNPGSPTQRRRQPSHTAGVLQLVDGRVSDARVVVVDGPVP